MFVPNTWNAFCSSIAPDVNAVAVLLVCTWCLISVAGWMCNGVLAWSCSAHIPIGSRM